MHCAFQNRQKKKKTGEGKREMDGRLNPCVCALCSGWEQMSRGSVLWPAPHCVRQTSLLIQLDQATLYSTAGGHIIALYKTSGRIKWDNAEVVSVCVLYSTKCLYKWCRCNRDTVLMARDSVILKSNLAHYKCRNVCVCHLLWISTGNLRTKYAFMFIHDW